jgi:hypothetical protein
VSASPGGMLITSINARNSRQCCGAWGRSLSAGASLSTRSQDHDASEWLERAKYWTQRLAGSNARKSKRQPSRDPLVLAGHGVSLRIEAGTLLVRNGFTHYPQKQETYRYFKGDAELPPRIIMLDGSGSITFDVL